MLCLCYPRPLSSTQLLLHSVGCCYDTTWKMTLEVNTQTQKSCYVFTHSVFFLLCMVDTIEKSCAHQSGVKPYWDCFAVSTLHNAAVVNINHTHTYKKKQTLDLLMKRWNTHVSTGCSFSWVSLGAVLIIMKPSALYLWYFLWYFHSWAAKVTFLCRSESSFMVSNWKPSSFAIFWQRMLYPSYSRADTGPWICCQCSLWLWQI